ncbi:MAG: hypothetical protein ACLFV8_10700 [Alphaproteobacteria bacterium]
MNDMDVRDLLSILFVVIAIVGLIGGFANRIALKKGIGTQFVRFMTIVVALPIAAALALQNMLTEAAVTLVLGILGYVFAGAKKDAE